MKKTYEVHITVFDGADTIKSQILTFSSEDKALDASKIAFQTAAELEDDDCES